MAAGAGDVGQDVGLNATEGWRAQGDPDAALLAAQQPQEDAEHVGLGDDANRLALIHHHHRPYAVEHHHRSRALQRHVGCGRHHVAVHQVADGQRRRLLDRAAKLAAARRHGQRLQKPPVADHAGQLAVTIQHRHPSQPFLTHPLQSRAGRVVCPGCNQLTGHEITNEHLLPPRARPQQRGQPGLLRYHTIRTLVDQTLHCSAVAGRDYEHRNAAAVRRIGDSLAEPVGRQQQCRCDRPVEGRQSQPAGQQKRIRFGGGHGRRQIGRLRAQRID